MCSLSALLLVLLVLLPSCSSDTPSPAEQPIRRTVLIYSAMHNSLGTSGVMRRDSAEIQAAASAISPTDRLLLFKDDGQRVALYRFRADRPQPELLREWPGGACSTSPEVLRQVWQWTVSQFPASEYGLVFESHADGWIPSTNVHYGTAPAASVRRKSFGIDTGQGGKQASDRDSTGQMGPQMNIDDLAESLSSVGVPLRYIFFDACMMQNVEVAWAFRDVTECLIASPISIPSEGGYYTHLVQNGLFSADPVQIARTYVADVLDPSLEASYSDFGIVLSAVNPSRLRALSEVLREELPQSTCSGHASANMDSVFHYYAYAGTYRYRPHHYDLRLALRSLLTEQGFARADQALSAAVLWHGASQRFWAGPSVWTYYDVPHDACGVSMFVPQDIYTQKAEVCPQGDLNAAFRRTGWYEAAGWSATGW